MQTLIQLCKTSNTSLISKKYSPHKGIEDMFRHISHKRIELDGNNKINAKLISYGTDECNFIKKT